MLQHKLHLFYISGTPNVKKIVLMREKGKKKKRRKKKS